MDELFGAPITSVAAVLGVVFVVVSLLLVFIAIRNPILVRMSVRNVLRRPARGVLIIVGLMLATAIISSAFTTGDAVSYSIKRDVIDSLRQLDELVRVDDDSEVWEGGAVPDDFPESIFAEVGPLLKADPAIDGVMPVVGEQVPVINQRTRQFEINALLTGIDPANTEGFGTVKDAQGNIVDIASLGPDEVFVDEAGALELGAEVGDAVGLALGPGDLREVRVKGIVDGWYVKREETEVVLLLSLARAQELLDLEGQLSFILISNRGDEFDGVERTAEVFERFEDLPALRDAGLEIFDVKRDLVELANQIGSLFLSLFTTFGLFSIGVGLLLIFLIFSMLAAERRAELGMARAIGMKRRHLVRMFIVEGAIYGVGSALVGTVAGVGLGFLLVIAVGAAFDTAEEGFVLSARVTLIGPTVAFLLGSVITFLTVIVASRRISKLNIVRAIRDIPEPQLARAGRRSLIFGVLIAGFGGAVASLGYASAQSTTFGLGVSLAPIGVMMVLRWKGFAQRRVLTGLGLYLLAFWLLPPAVLNRIRDDWSDNFSIFFVASALTVTGAVLVTMNNPSIVVGILTGTLGRFRRWTPIVKSAVSYPMRFPFRTGLSVAMFSVVVFSVTVLLVIIGGFNKLLEDQERLAGGYDVMAFSQADLNPLPDLTAAVRADPGLDLVLRVGGAPSVGTFRSIFQADGRLAGSEDGADTSITGFDDDFVSSNRFAIRLATDRFTDESGVDSAAVWQALRANPRLAVVNALMVPTRDNFGFQVESERFTLAEVEDLFIQNDTMDPVEITVEDKRSGATVDLTVIGVLDDLASQGPIPSGIFVSTETLVANVPREIEANQFFFHVAPSTEDPAGKIEAALFEHGLETIDIAKLIKQFQDSNRAFNNLLIGFMLLGLLAGIIALGVISARTVVERRHQIGLLRAIGFSRGMVQMTFLAESTFIAVLGIAIGLGFGLLMGINVVSDIRNDEPNIELIIPWGQLALIAVGAYAFSLVMTYLPSRQAARVAPAEALRYE